MDILWLFLWTQTSDNFRIVNYKLVWTVLWLFLWTQISDSENLPSLWTKNSDNLQTPQRLNFVAPQYNLGGQTSGESAVWTHFLIV